MRGAWKVVLAVLVAFAPGRARAQTPDELMRTALERSARVGVPVELLQSKIDEGRAKGVPADRIAGAVALRLETLERLEERLADARPSPAELGAAADASAAGLSNDQIARVVAAAGERRAVALVVVTQLVQQGEAPTESVERVLSALARMGQVDDLLELPDEIAVAAARKAQNGGSGRGGAPAGVPAGAKGGSMMGPTMMGGKRE